MPLTNMRDAERGTLPRDASQDSIDQGFDENIDSMVMEQADAEANVVDAQSPGALDDASLPDAQIADAMVVDQMLDPPDERLNIPFHRGIFGATHNSYSGGDRGSIVTQLNQGIRGLELDFHDDDYGDRPDWQVGHFDPGEDVLFGNGNPIGDGLTNWLRVIKTWSQNNSGHGPITLVLDSKDPLDDNYGPEHGNLGTLNQRLLNIFGDRLMAAEEVTGEWPAVRAFVDRILVVLSGHRGTRSRYVRDEGIHPAIATSPDGRIIEVHQSENGYIWYWTGQINPDNRVTWHHHGRLGRG